MKGKTAIVTGGRGGMGSAVVKRLLREGLSVVSSVTKEEPGAEKGVVEIRSDVTVETDIEALFKAAVDRFGSVDIVVNTVGGFLPQKPTSLVTVGEWDMMMNVNLKSAFLCSREALRHMKGRNYGRIINFSAMVGLIPVAEKIPYVVSKAGVAVLTEALAKELRGSGITINAIAPGIIDTDANRKSMPDADYRKWVSAESIVDLIWWLCSPNGESVSGTTFRTFGGI